jgi:hypothetical protein
MKLALATIILLASSVSHADWTNGYTRSNGTHVEGYHHTHADSNPYNNYSSQGNVNPYTGAVGHVNPSPNPAIPNYFQNSQDFGGN